MARNVLGSGLQTCSMQPLTGFFRDGCCKTGPQDLGVHTVCAEVTGDFLAFSFATGNDLITPRPEALFPGLKPGDRWCVCAARWKEAFDAGVACPVYLHATHEASLKIVPFEDLVRYALDTPAVPES